MKKIIKSIALFLTIVLCVSLCACGNSAKTLQNESYSVGLLDTGYYINWEKQNLNAIDFTKIDVTIDDVLQWCVDADETNTIKTIDEYVYAYANQFLLALGAGQKDVVENGDKVEINMSFSIDGQKLEDYQANNATYTAASDGDAIISSFIGHKKAEKYTVKYTFPAEDEYYPNKEADVEIEIIAIAVADPLAQDLVEQNLDKIAEYIDGVTDKESLLTNIRPIIAEAMLPGYMREAIQLTEDYPVPQEYVDYELTRFKVRLDRLGYTYDHYLEEAKTSDTDIRVYCKAIAQENCIYLKHYDTMDYEITDEDLRSAFGDNYDYVYEIQGLPYMKLDLIRELALDDICSKVNLIGRVSNDTESESESTDETTDPTESTGTEVDSTIETTEPATTEDALTSN